jgi:Ras-related protein Rab-1A
MTFYKQSNLFKKLVRKDLGKNFWPVKFTHFYRTITSSYYRGAQGMLMVFDLSNASTFKNLSKNFQEVERYAEEDVRVIIVGT